jgi:hypothetical protein
MGIKQFFNKAGQGLKKFFGKDGTLESTFKKGGSAEKLVNKIGAGIDTGLKAVGNVAGKVGNIVSDVSPLITAINPEIGLALGGIGKLAGQVGGGVKKAQDLKKTAVTAFKKPINQMGSQMMGGASGILAPKPEAENDGNELNGPLFA